MKSDEEVNFEAHEMVLEDHDYITDLYEKYNTIRKSLEKDEEVEYFQIATTNITLGLKLVQFNLDSILQVYAADQKTPKEVKHGRPN